MRLFKVYKLALGLFIAVNIMFATDNVANDLEDEETELALTDPDDNLDGAADGVSKAIVAKKTPEEMAKEIDQAVQDLFDAEQLYDLLKKSSLDEQVPPILLTHYPGV